MNSPPEPSTDSAADVSWRMPAEWEQHERCLLAWPSRSELWEGYLDRAKAEYAATAAAISQFEPVTVIAAPGSGAEARRACPGDIDVVELPIDDSWIRDSGPIYVVDDAGHRRGVDFRFNSWGERFLPYDKDAAITEAVLAHLGDERVSSSMVLEGGSITVDGAGTLITTEQCLLNPNRNPDWDRNQIEAELQAQLGVETIIWLPWGHAEDGHTDGHVDGVCTYAAPGVVIAQTCEDPANPNYRLMAENLEVLHSARDSAGRSFRIIELPQLPYSDLDGRQLLCSYPNFYVANGGVVVGVGNHPLDQEALALIGQGFPDHQVVSVPSLVVAFGGGGVHCITQQVPVGRSRS